MITLVCLSACLDLPRQPIAQHHAPDQAVPANIPMDAHPPDAADPPDLSSISRDASSPVVDAAPAPPSSDATRPNPALDAAPVPDLAIASPEDVGPMGRRDMGEPDAVPPMIDSTPENDDAAAPSPEDAGPMDDCADELEICDGRDNDCDDRVDEAAAVGGRCRCVAIDDGPFELCTRGVRWVRAQAACEARGASLAVVGSAEHNATLMAHVAEIEAEFGARAQRAWIGLNDRVLEGEFVWVNGAAAPFRAWATDEPNDWGEGEDCVEIAFDVPGREGNFTGWNDESCGASFAFICNLD